MKNSTLPELRPLGLSFAPVLRPLGRRFCQSRSDLKVGVPKTLHFLLIISALTIIGCETKPYRQGQELYEGYCANCHMEDGSGLRGLIPPLAGADYLKNNVGALPCLIKKGMKGAITVNGKTYEGEMPPAEHLTEFEITNIINYINTAWGNNLPIVKHESVKAKLMECD